MAMEITNNYSSYAAQSVAESSTANSTKKKETEKTTETLESNREKRQLIMQMDQQNLFQVQILRLEMPVHQPKTASH